VEGTCRGCGFNNRLQRLQSRSVQEGGCLRVICNIHEPVVTSNGPQNVSGPLQAVLQLVVRGNVLYFIPKVRVGPELGIQRTRQMMIFSFGCVEDVSIGIQSDSLSSRSSKWSYGIVSKISEINLIFSLHIIVTCALGKRRFFRL
jgi:hypothetical protein